MNQLKGDTKGKYYNLLGTDLWLESSNLDSLGDVSELSEFSGTLSSTKLTENSSKEGWIDSIYFSDLMPRTRKTIRLEEELGTSWAGGQDRTEAQGIECQTKLQMKGTKKGKKTRWDLAVTAAELA